MEVSTIIRVSARAGSTLIAAANESHPFRHLAIQVPIAVKISLVSAFSEN